MGVVGSSLAAAPLFSIEKYTNGPAQQENLHGRGGVITRIERDIAPAVEFWKRVGAEALSRLQINLVLWPANSSLGFAGIERRGWYLRGPLLGS